MMISSRVIDPEYSPFLEWNQNDRVTVDSVSRAFISLVSMIRDGYQFTEKLISNTSLLLVSMSQNVPFLYSIDDLLNAIGQGSTEPATVLVDSVIVLLSSPYPSILLNTLYFILNILRLSSSLNCLALFSSQLIRRILSTPGLRDLSVIADKRTLNCILILFNFCAKLSSTKSLRILSTASNTDPQAIRDVVLREVLIPMEPYLVQISRNRLLLSWDDEFRTIFKLVLSIIYEGAFHQPTLTFLCSSHVPMVFQSLLSEVEHEDPHQEMIWLISSSIHKWKNDETQSFRGGMILLKTLEQEGLFDG